MTGSVTDTPGATPAGTEQIRRPLASNDETRDMFLQLLVAQIQNQDPFSPMDPTQFVSQLAQFSEMEQTIEIRKTLEGIHGLMQAEAALAEIRAAAPGSEG